MLSNHLSKLWGGGLGRPGLRVKKMKIVRSDAELLHTKRET